MKKSYCLSILLAVSWQISLAQTPTGTSTGLCPGQQYTYFTDASCTSTFKWSVTNGEIYQQGVGTLGAYAIVKWWNESTGRISTFCGGLDVSINKNPPPVISGSYSYLLCAGSMT